MAWVPESAAAVDEELVRSFALSHLKATIRQAATEHLPFQSWMLHLLPLKKCRGSLGCLDLGPLTLHQIAVAVLSHFRFCWERSLLAPHDVQSVVGRVRMPLSKQSEAELAHLRAELPVLAETTLVTFVQVR